MKSEKFASVSHISTILSHIYARLSQTYIEYPNKLLQVGNKIQTYVFSQLILVIAS